MQEHSCGHQCLLIEAVLLAGLEHVALPSPACCTTAAAGSADASCVDHIHHCHPSSELFSWLAAAEAPGALDC